MADALCTVTAADGSRYVVVEGMIHLPRVGVWHADLTIDAPGASVAMASLSGKALITLAGVDYSGTFDLNGATQQDTIRARINGGAGGFSTVLTPKGYRGTTLKIVIGDLLAAAGEHLSPTADPAVLATNLPFWVQVQQPAGLALQSALQVTGATWRVLTDGTVWIGTESYPPTTQADFVLLSNEPEQARYEFGSYLPTLLPGETFQGQRVSAVIHYIRPRGLSSQVFTE